MPVNLQTKDYNCGQDMSDPEIDALANKCL